MQTDRMPYNSDRVSFLPLWNKSLKVIIRYTPPVQFLKYFLFVELPQNGITDVNRMLAPIVLIIKSRHVTVASSQTLSSKNWPRVPIGPKPNAYQRINLKKYKKKKPRSLEESN